MRSTGPTSLSDLRAPICDGITAISSAPPPQGHSLVGRLADAVCRRRPVLGTLIARYGEHSLLDYAKERLVSSMAANDTPTHTTRREDLLAAFRQELLRNFSHDLAESAAMQLRKYYLVSTADHLGPLCDEIALSSNLLAALPYADMRDPLLRCVVVLACSTVSLNNPSFPRGLQFSLPIESACRRQRLPFVSAASRNMVHTQAPYGTEAVARTQQTIQMMLRKNMIPCHVASKLASLVEEVYARPDVLSTARYSDQVTKTNLLLWRRVFHGTDAPPLDILYVELESLVTRLLSLHLPDKTSIIHRLLFDRAYQDSVEKRFDGVYGAFTRGERKGTYLFWAVSPKEMARTQLWRDGSDLASEDGSCRLALSPRAVQQALDSKQIVPSLLLDYLVLAFYYGLQCMGGSSQVHYLTEMKKAYVDVLSEYGHAEEISFVEGVETQSLICNMQLPFLAFPPTGECLPATTLDLMLYGDTSRLWRVVTHVSQALTVGESLHMMMPELYGCYANGDKEPDLAALRPWDVAQLLGIGRNILPCGTLVSRVNSTEAPFRSGCHSANRDGSGEPTELQKTIQEAQLNCRAWEGRDG